MIKYLIFIYSFILILILSILLWGCKKPNKKEVHYFTNYSKDINGDIVLSVISEDSTITFVYKNIFSCRVLKPILESIDKNKQGWSCLFQNKIDSLGISKNTSIEYYKIIEMVCQNIINKENFTSKDIKMVSSIFNELYNNNLISSLEKEWSSQIDSFYKNIIYNNKQYHYNEWYLKLDTCEIQNYLKIENELRFPSNDSTIYFADIKANIFFENSMDYRPLEKIFYKLTLKNDKGKTIVKITDLNRNYRYLFESEYKDFDYLSYYK